MEIHLKKDLGEANSSLVENTKRLNIQIDLLKQSENYNNSLNKDLIESRHQADIASIEVSKYQDDLEKKQNIIENLNKEHLDAFKKIGSLESECDLAKKQCLQYKQELDTVRRSLRESDLVNNDQINLLASKDDIISKLEKEISAHAYELEYNPFKELIDQQNNTIILKTQEIESLRNKVQYIKFYL
jgi:septation ring formation regulator EzrA